MSTLDLDLSPQKKALLEKLLRKQGIQAAPVRTIPRRSEAGPAPLSFAQQRLWFLDQLDPGSAVYNVPFVLRLEGTVDVAALAACLREIQRRHEVLRTVFPSEQGLPVQVARAAADLPLAQADLAAVPAGKREAIVRALIEEEVRRPFDLQREPVVRAALLRLEEAAHVLVLCMHHIAADGWSMGVLVRELTTLYPAFAAGSPSPLPELPVQYADFAVWQRERLQGKRLEELLGYWREQLAGYSGVLALPTDRPRPAAQTFSGAQRSLILEGEALERLRDFGTREGVTSFMVFLAAFFSLLERWTGQADLGVGVPVANRLSSEIEGLIGFFVNTLVLRADLGGDPAFREVVRRVRAASLGADAHQELPFEKLVDEIRPERSLSVTPLYQVMFVHQSRSEAVSRIPGLAITALPADTGTVKNDLVFAAIEADDRMILSLQYNLDLFDGTTIERMLGHLGRLLPAACAAPELRLSELPLLSPAESWLLRGEANDTAAEQDLAACLHDRFAAQVERSPDAAAATWRGESLSYRELGERANRLAGRLRSLGVGPEIRVGVCLPRSLDMLVSLLGVLEAGGTYLPLDPEYPAERLAFMMEDGGAAVLVTAGDLAARFPGFAGPVVRLDADAAELASLPAARPRSVALPEHLAYVIYTSGSTGRPKGVAIQHRSAVALLDWAHGIFPPEDLAGVLAATSICFDLSVFEIFVPLTRGGRIVLVENALELGRVETGAPVTLINTVPSAIAELARSGAIPATVRTINLAGEPLPGRLVRQIEATGTDARIFNLYGPSEDTTYSTGERVGVEGEPTIGRPLTNTRVHLLDAALQPVPLGARGEIFIGGSGLARGYLGRPELTAERFVPDAFSGLSGARVYRTGDLARRRTDGRLEFLGRIDHQVKVRGFRIELGEIETALRQHPAVQEALALARDDDRGGQRLVGFVAARAGESTDAEALRAFLQERLPGYMVPPVLLVLDAFPLTPNGKIDRPALLALESGRRTAAERPYAAPRTPVEEALAEIWAGLLGCERVGLHDNFFELGGDSILGIQVVARAAQRGIRLTPRQIFQHQSIARLAEVAGAAPEFVAEQGRVSGRLPLTPVQRWFFELDLRDPHHFNQGLLLEAGARLDADRLERAVAALVDHHDALRLRFSGAEAFNAAAEESRVFAQVDLTALPEAARRSALEAAAAQAQASLDLAAGPLLRALLFAMGGAVPGRLLLAIHHLAVDGVSWRILLEDLQSAYDQLGRSGEVRLPAKTTSYKAWAERLVESAAERLRELPLWLSLGEGALRPLPVDFPQGGNAIAAARTVTLSLDPEETRALLQEVPKAYRTQIDDALLAALALALSAWAGPGTFLVDLEGHGREEIFADVDLSRTVGWFTSIYPVRLDLGGAAGAGEAVKRVKETLRAVADRGVGYGLLRFLAEEAEALRALPRAEISFNYLGQLDQAFAGSGLLAPAREGAGATRSRRQERPHRLEVHGHVSDGRLHLSLTYAESLHRRASIEDLAARLGESLRALIVHCQSVEAGCLTPSDVPLARLDQTALDHLCAGGAAEDIYPLSPLQQGLLFHSLYTPGSEVYLEQVSWRIEGDLDLAAYERAWRALLERHRVLRTAFFWKGLTEPLQVVRPSVELALGLLDWRGLPDGQARERWDDLLRSERVNGFDLQEAPLLRLVLARTGDRSWSCAWTFHHLLLDGWSLPVVFGDLLALYAAFHDGVEPRLAAVRPYSDYIAWLQRQDLAETEAFWRGTLDGFGAPTPLVVDRPLAAGAFGAEHREIRTRLPEPVTEALRTAAQRHRVTLNTLLQAAWALLLSRYSNEEDVLFGATVSGRPAALPGVETMVGLFINTLPVRVRVAADRDLPAQWRELQDLQVEMRQHEHSPLPQVQRWSRVPGGVPLFESLLVFENYPVESSLHESEASLRVVDVHVRETTNYPLTLALGPGATLLAKIGYDARRFDDDAVERMLGHLRTLLRGIAAHPESRPAELPLLTREEERQILDEGGTAAGPAGAAAETVIDLFQARVAETPGAVALIAGEERWTYEQLSRRANRLACHLRAHGVAPGMRVGVCMQRSPELVAVLLAILQAGGVYVPLDPEYPRERLAFMVEDAELSVLLTEQRLMGMLPASGFAVLAVESVPAEGGEDPASAAAPDQLAYMIYTSGSTGRPKAVMATHGNLAAVLRAGREALGFHAGDAMPCIASFSFDISLFELLSPLLVGGTSILVAHRPVFNLEEVLGAVAGATVLHAVPGLLRQILARAQGSGTPAAPRLRALLTGGDLVPLDLLREARETFPQTALHVLYGPTETTIICSAHAVGEEVGDRNLIGRSLPGARLMIADRDGNPAPLGVPGEILVAGSGVTRGYWKRPELTAATFVPRGGGVHYRTGDLGRRLASGEIEFLGRIDHQVKVRGFRVELGEIESVLARHPALREVVVLAREDGAGDKRLVAYVVPRPERDAPPADELRAFLRGELPEFMVPSAFVALDALPLTANAKVDRKALPDPAAGARPGLSTAYAPPESAVERSLSALWQEILGLASIGVHDNFFDLGGHSLHLIRMHDRIGGELGVELTMLDLFQHPTIRSMAELLAQRRGAAETADAAPREGAASGASVQRGDARAEARKAAMMRRQQNRRGPAPGQG